MTAIARLKMRKLTSQKIFCGDEGLALQRSCNAGQSLIEAIVSISVLTTGLLGVLALFSKSISVNRQIADNYIATYLAAEGIEGVKNLIDANFIQEKPWGEGFGGGGNFELVYHPSDGSFSLEPYQGRFLNFDPVSNLYSYNTGGRPTNFKRIIKIDFLGSESEEMSVNSIVEVSRFGGVQKVDLEDHFFNWRQ